MLSKFFIRKLDKLGVVQKEVVEKQQAQLDALQKEVDKFKVEPDTKRYVREQLEPVLRRIEETNSSIQQQARVIESKFAARDKDVLQDFIAIRKKIIAFEQKLAQYDSLPNQTKQALGEMENYRHLIDKAIAEMEETVAEDARKVDKFDSTYHAMLRQAHIGESNMISQHW